jgi:hypothetical protein
VVVVAFVVRVAQHQFLEVAPLEDRRPLFTSAGHEVHPNVHAAAVAKEYVDIIGVLIKKQRVDNMIRISPLDDGGVVGPAKVEVVGTAPLPVRVSSSPDSSVPSHRPLLIQLLRRSAVGRGRRESKVSR